MVIANPLPADEQLDPALHDETLATGLSMMEREGITGKAVTPFLLAHFHSATGARSLAVNVQHHPAQRRAGRPDRGFGSDSGRDSPSSRGSRSGCGSHSRSGCGPHSGFMTTHVLVVGDIVTDIVAVVDGPIAHASDTPAAITVTGGGSAANTVGLAGRGRCPGHALRCGRRGPDGPGPPR